LFPQGRRHPDPDKVTVPPMLAKFPLLPPAKEPHSMTISMYKTSVPIFVQFLTSMSAVLDKAAAHCEAKKIEPATLLNMRLYPDMFPLVRQLRAVTDHAISGTARLAGAELITFPNTEASFPEVKDRIAKTIDFVKSFKPVQIDGTEDKEIVVKFSSGERKFKGQTFLLNFCLPNFYFHATTAYDILRHCGIELGKRDFMGTPVAL
jgi:hypothetical protein